MDQQKWIPDQKRWLDIRDAAEYLTMSEAFLRKAVREQSIPFTRVGAKSLRFDRTALDEWLASMSSVPKGRK